MSAAHRRLIDQQHPARSPSAMVAHQRRPRPHQVVHEVPTHPGAARRRADRHHRHVAHQAPRQAPRHLALKLRMLLQMASRAVLAAPPPAPPQQHHLPPRHRLIPDPLDAPVMHPAALEPAMRAPRPRPRRLHRHHQAARRVRHHLQHAHLTQVQPHPHNIRTHRGPPGSALSQPPMPAGPRPHLRDPQLHPIPQKREAPTNRLFVQPDSGIRGRSLGTGHRTARIPIPQSRRSDD